jgi:hypothetical protein
MELKTTKRHFDRVLSDSKSVVRNTYCQGEYVTSVYRDGVLTAERVIYNNNVEYIKVSKR